MDKIVSLLTLVLVTYKTFTGTAIATLLADWPADCGQKRNEFHIGSKVMLINTHEKSNRVILLYYTRVCVVMDRPNGNWENPDDHTHTRDLIMFSIFCLFSFCFRVFLDLIYLNTID